MGCFGLPEVAALLGTFFPTCFNRLNYVIPFNRCGDRASIGLSNPLHVLVPRGLLCAVLTLEILSLLALLYIGRPFFALLIQQVGERQLDGDILLLFGRCRQCGKAVTVGVLLLMERSVRSAGARSCRWLKPSRPQLLAIVYYIRAVLTA